MSTESTVTHHPRANPQIYHSTDPPCAIAVAPRIASASPALQQLVTTSRRTFVARVAMALALGAPSHSVFATTADKAVSVLALTLLDDDFFKEAVQGMEDRAKRDNVTLLVGNVSGNLGVEERLIDRYVQRGVDAIIVSPVNVTQSVPALARAHNKGIKIITYNNTVGADFVASSITSDQQQLGSATGEAARQYIAEKMGGEASIGVLRFDALHGIQSDARVLGFFNAATRGLPNARVIAQQEAWETDQAIVVTRQMLKNHPKIDLIFAANEGGTVGAQLAVRSAGLSHRVKIFGIDASAKQLAMLQSADGVLQATTRQQSLQIGQTAMDSAIRAIRGQPVEKSITIQGELLTRKMRPSGLQ